jgi:branched-chain amino acid transport system substrate-binding protein
LPWIDDVNARGGIHGRKVIMTEVDNQTTAEGAVAACKEETGNGSLFAVLQSNFSSEADCVDKAGMPTLVLGGSEIVSKWRHVHVLTLGKDGATNAASFLKNSLGDGAKKIGLIYVKNAFDGERIKNAFVARTKALGVNVVDAEPIQQNQASFVGELQNLRAKGAETVVIYAVLEVLGILRDARALNYAPHWIGITWTVDTLSKAARNVMDGIHGVRLYATVNSPAYKSYLAMAQKYGQGNNADSSGMYWYGVGLLLDVQRGVRQDPELQQQHSRAPVLESRSAPRDSRLLASGLLQPRLHLEGIRSREHVRVTNAKSKDVRGGGGQHGFARRDRFES